MNRIRILILLLVFLSLCRNTLGSSGRNIVVLWNSAALQSVSDSTLGAPMVSRALAIVDTCMYDAWAAYDDRAVGTQLGGALRRPPPERTVANKQKAISYAAYRALVDVLPLDSNSVYKPLMNQLGYDPNDNSADIETPAGIGNVACSAVLEFRHHDKSNQLGDLAQGPYSDWSGYSAVNKPTSVPVRIKMNDPNHWQPLIFVSSAGDFMTQRFMAAQWCFVTPFALSKGDEFRSIAETLGPAKHGSQEYEGQAEELVHISANLTDREKMIAEYWSDGPHTEQPPGHWMRFAQWVSRRDHQTLDAIRDSVSNGGSISEGTANYNVAQNRGFLWNVGHALGVVSTPQEKAFRAEIMADIKAHPEKYPLLLGIVYPSGPLGKAASRAAELAGTMGKTKGFVTIAVTETEEGVSVISSSENALRPAVKGALTEGEIAAEGAGHAEVTGVNAAKELGLSPTGTAASKGICPSCAEFLHDLGVAALSWFKP